MKYVQFAMDHIESKIIVIEYNFFISKNDKMCTLNLMTIL